MSSAGVHALLRFNEGPRWLWRQAYGLWSALERYGWALVACAVAAAWLWPKLRRNAADLSRRFQPQGAQAEAERIAKLDAQRHAQVEQKQQELFLAQAAWEKVQAEKDLTRRRHKIEELDKEAVRLGLRPPGKAYRLADASVTSEADDDLYQ